jgi:hypothetical protein
MADGDLARLLCHGALYAHDDLPAAVATSPQLLDQLVARWRVFAPLHRWLVDHVQHR